MQAIQIKNKTVQNIQLCKKYAKQTNWPTKKEIMSPSNNLISK